jgi:hypothetical protein
MTKPEIEKILAELEIICNSQSCKGEKRKYMLISAIGSGVVWQPKPVYACETCLETKEIPYKMACSYK